MATYFGCTSSLIELAPYNLVSKDSKIHFESFFYIFLKINNLITILFSLKKIKKNSFILCKTNETKNAI